MRHSLLQSPPAPPSWSPEALLPVLGHAYAVTHLAERFFDFERTQSPRVQEMLLPRLADSINDLRAAIDQVVPLNPVNGASIPEGASLENLKAFDDFRQCFFRAAEALFACELEPVCETPLLGLRGSLETLSRDHWLAPSPELTKFFRVLTSNPSTAFPCAVTLPGQANSAIHTDLSPTGDRRTSATAAGPRNDTERDVLRKVARKEPPGRCSRSSARPTSPAPPMTCSGW